jgi:hypothetical protein
MKRKLLFVTSRDGDFDQTFRTLDLAKMTDRMAILLVKKKIFPTGSKDDDCHHLCGGGRA